MKRTMTLECSLVRYKEVESEAKQVEQELALLHEQVEEARKKRENMLGEQRGISRSSKKMKMELEALGKEWAEFEVNAKAAEEEETTLHFIDQPKKYYIYALIIVLFFPFNLRPSTLILILDV